MSKLLRADRSQPCPRVDRSRRGAGDQAGRKGCPRTKQYCLKFADDTGSHLTRTECRTKKQWKRSAWMSTSSLRAEDPQDWHDAAGRR